MTTENGLARLPNIESALLPARYAAAKVAMSECTHLDECKTWADQAEAMASYARQAHDDSLRQFADRIQARAIRRCGELLRQIAPHHSGRPKLGWAPTLISRKAAARAAGLSPNQQKQALRVERVPEDVFETMVESDDPPTITKLAEMGTPKHIRNTSADPFAMGKRPHFAEATKVIGAINLLAEVCLAHDPRLVVQGVLPHEVAELKAHVNIIDPWIDSFIVNLKE